MSKFWGGTAKKLRGDCVAVAIFVSEGDPWSEETKETAWANLETAMKWIEEQAKEYDVELNIETHCVNWEEDIVLDAIPRFETYDYNTTNAALQEIAKQLDYENVTEFYQAMKEEFEGKSMHFLFLNNIESRCHMNSVRIDDEAIDFEYNMIYAYEGEISTFTLAHESLHAYSAMDLYNVYESKEGQKAMDNAAKRFPQEVMLTNTGDVNDSELSEFTAFLVGWHDEPEDWYSTIVQPHDKDQFTVFLKNHAHFDEDGNVIIEEEEELARYSYEDGEIVRYMINGQEDLVHWKVEGGDTETEYWEDSIDEHYYYLQDKNSADKITVPIKGGTGYMAENTTGDYKPWTEFEVMEA